MYRYDVNLISTKEHEMKKTELIKAALTILSMMNDCVEVNDTKAQKMIDERIKRMKKYLEKNTNK